MGGEGHALVRYFGLTNCVYGWEGRAPCKILWSNKLCLWTGKDVLLVRYFGLTNCVYGWGRTCSL